jgi:hypothetical protein
MFGLKVIFLDIDGVLNSEAYALKLEERHYQLGHAEPPIPNDETTCDCFKLYHQIDRDAVARLNRLVVTTSAKIVVSSTWRKRFDLPELHRILSEHGLVAEIIGATPDGYKDPELRAAFGYIDRIFRGHEIDYWLKQHPEVDRFVILDDDSDMEMHKNRLVQTDCQEGLLDDHVELAIRMMSWDGKTVPPAAEQEAPKRSARGPLIVQVPTLLNLVNDQLRQESPPLRRPSPNQGGAVSDNRPGSSAGIHCHQGGCVESLTLERTTTVTPTHEDDYQTLMPALDEAAVLLGWRIYRSVPWCPTHVVAKNLACKRCMMRCPACACVGGPRFDAIEGLEG